VPIPGGCAVLTFASPGATGPFRPAASAIRTVKRAAGAAARRAFASHPVSSTHLGWAFGSAERTGQRPHLRRLTIADGAHPRGPRAACHTDPRASRARVRATGRQTLDAAEPPQVRRDGDAAERAIDSRGRRGNYGLCRQEVEAAAPHQFSWGPVGRCQQGRAGGDAVAPPPAVPPDAARAPPDGHQRPAPDQPCRPVMPHPPRAARGS
jgi:hypothetical protein